MNTTKTAKDCPFCGRKIRAMPVHAGGVASPIVDWVAEHPFSKRCWVGGSSGGGRIIKLTVWNKRKETP